VRELYRDAPTAQVRSHTAQIGFGVEKIETPVEQLSGGEKVRLLLGLIGLSKPNILILDEPTSHLDVDSREALVYALADFGGAVLLITHDVYLAEASADRLLLVKDGRAAAYDGDLDAYRALLAQSAKAERAAKADREPRPTKPIPARAPESGEAKRALAAARKALTAAEAGMEKAQAELDALDAQLADPDLFQSAPGRGADLARRRADAATRLSKTEAEWIAAAEALDALRGAGG
jgi:ATP-binding cassette subfamily F protein 3